MFRLILAFIFIANTSLAEQAAKSRLGRTGLPKPYYTTNNYVHDWQSFPTVKGKTLGKNTRKTINKRRPIIGGSFVTKHAVKLIWTSERSSCPTHKICLYFCSRYRSGRYGVYKNLQVRWWCSDGGCKTNESISSASATDYLRLR